MLKAVYRGDWKETGYRNEKKKNVGSIILIGVYYPKTENASSYGGKKMLLLANKIKY